MKEKKKVKNRLDVFDFASRNPLMYVGIKNDFINKIRILIISKYKTLKKFNQEFLKIDYPNLKHEFKEAKYHSLVRWINILKAFKISREELFKNIICFRVSGSHSKNIITLPRILILDEKFIEGYSLYLAEGDTGLSGKKIPKKLRFTNANLGVIKFFIDWLKCYFPNNNFYVNAIIPNGIGVEKDFSKKISEKLDIETNTIKVKNDYYNDIIKYRVCCDSIIIIDLVLSLDAIIKRICSTDRALAIGYIKGIMAGEGTVYFNKSRYVRVEMKNEREIKYIYNLLRNLKYDCKISLRTERPRMWSVYIGAKQLEKFYKEIGFGSQQDRQNILKLAVDKRLRLNQYV